MKVEQKVLVLSALILAVTGVIKLGSAAQNIRLLSEPDSLFQALSLKQVLLVTGIVEVILSGFVLFSSKPNLIKFAAIAWFSTAAAAYRALLLLSNSTKPCPCLGNLGAWLHLNPGSMERLGLFLLAFLFLGSYFFLLRCWRANVPI
jgi:hypothetical protein